MTSQSFHTISLQLINYNVFTGTPRKDAASVLPAISRGNLDLQLLKAKQENKALLAELAKMERITMSQDKEIVKLKEQLKNCKSQLSQYMSSSQIDCVFRKKAVHRWEDEDISHAISLRNLSNKAYKYVKNEWKIPLPSVTTLKRRTAHVNVEPGILMSVLSVIEKEAVSMTERDRVSVLSFDECSLCREWSYDKATDTLYAPKKNVQCCMLRGIVGSWKQLIYYDFDCPMTKDLLFSIISQVEAAGFPVVATVNDMGTSNMSLWNSLNVSTETPYFTNPAVTSRKVYVLADVPHLMKLMRNHFLDDGFVMQDGKVVDSSCVREVVARSKADLKATYHLSHRHIEVKGAQRMNVRLAVQLLSAKTSKSLAYLGERGLINAKTWSSTSEFIALVNNWFDLMNSRVLFAANMYSSAYGATEMQKYLLEMVISVISKMHVFGKKHLLPFQKGVIISSKSLMQLHSMLKKDYNISFVMTYKLNQDVLEHFFAYMRQLGGRYEHPSPVSVKHRVRSYLVGKKSSLMGDKYNILQENKENNLASAACSKVDEKEKHNETALDQELCLSSMSLVAFVNDMEEFPENVDSGEADLGRTLENETETQGMAYFGGYIARKFPQYKLGSKYFKSEKSSWIDTVSRQSDKLVKPNDEFMEKLKTLGQLFNCYHGKNTLKAGKSVVSKTASSLKDYVELPEEVISFYVRCRIFFRIRILNDNMRITGMQRKLGSKMNKLLR